MSTRNLRNRISSRQPSPANGSEANATAAATPEDGVAGRQDDSDPEVWHEPVVRKLPPSYQDHKGLERVGVLELQQPLGELPSSKLLQRLKLSMPRNSPRPTLLPADEVVTPTVESDRPDLGSPMDLEGHVEAVHLLQHREEPTVVSSPPRGRPAKRDAAEMKHSVQPEGTPSPVKSTFSSSTPQFPTKPASIQEHLRQDRVQNYVDKAIQEAEEKGEPGLIPGLRKIREDAFHKRDLWGVLDAIAHNQPSEEQLSIFKRFIKKGVKRHRRNTLTPSNQAADSPHPNPAFPARSLSANAENLSSISANPANSSTIFTSPFRPRPDSSNLQPGQSTSKSSGHTPGSRRNKMPSTNDRGVGQSKSTDSPRRRRSRSNSSSSSLSSAKSILVDFAPPPPGTGDAAGGPEHLVRNGLPRQSNTKTRAQTQPSTAHPFAGLSDGGKLADKRLKKAQRQDLDYDPVEVEQKRQKFASSSYQNYNYQDLEETDERHRVSEANEAPADEQFYIPAPVVHAHPVQPSFSILSDGLEGLTTEVRNGTSRKRRFDEMDEEELDIPTSLSSSPMPPYAPPPPPPGVLASRSGTPRSAKLPAINKARKSARVMISPNKPKNGGITAGIARAGTGKDFVIGNGAESGAEDNDEQCAACGGEGTLLCCDGCTNSMHHACLDPPLNPDDEVNGEWFCPKCTAKRNKNAVEAPGFLGKVISRMDSMIPKAFTLPFDVRDYFEGVRTGDSGEYEEFGQPATQQAPRMNRAGFFEEPNHKDARDNKGKLITCYRCGQGTNGRDIIPCSYCPARWHLDCCDPPLAVPPRRRPGDKPGATWRCPLHIDGDLAAIGRQAEAAPGDLGRQPRPRVPKNSRPKDVALPRGFRNNGVIEVELMREDAPAIREVDMHGQIFRLPEEGIRLDFIDRVKRSWYEDQQFAELSGRPRKMREKLYKPANSVDYHQPKAVIFKRKEPEFYTGSQALAVTETAKANAALRHKTLTEQQAILSLASMSQKGPAYSGDALADLTNQLVIDAPPQAEVAILRSEKEQLLHLQQLVARRLRILDGVDVPPANQPKAIAPRPPPLLAPKPPTNTPGTSTGHPPPHPSWSPPMHKDDGTHAKIVDMNGRNGTSSTFGQHSPVQPFQPMLQQPTRKNSGSQSGSGSGSRPPSRSRSQGQTQSRVTDPTESGGTETALDPRLLNGQGDDGANDEAGTDGDIEMSASP